MTNLEQFYNELNEYFDSKIAEVDISTRREAAMFVVQWMMIRERDLTEEIFRQFRKSMGSTRGVNPLNMVNDKEK